MNSILPKLLLDQEEINIDIRDSDGELPEELTDNVDIKELFAKKRDAIKDK